MFENRKYVIINSEYIQYINFNEVLETSEETLRFSANKNKTFFKYENKEPSFMNMLPNYEGPYTYEEMSNVLLGEEWLLSTE